MVSYILAVIAAVGVFVADRLTKAYIVGEFALAESRTFIPGLLDFTYVHNKGGAWGMLNGHTWLLVSLTVIVMIICLSLLITKGLKNKTLFWAIILVLSGGMGNLVDRIFNNGTVIDFLHLHFMPDFPVFNIADCAVVIGAALLILELVIDMVTDHRKVSSENEKKETSSNE